MNAGRALGDWAMNHGHHLLRILGSTWRLRFFDREPVDRCRFGRGPVMYAMTHGVLLPLAYAHRDRRIQVLVSESRDGEIIARIIGRMGFHLVRGSNTRGGERAALEMVRRGREGFDLGITPDGPKGPRGSVAPGALLVAARAQVPIVAIGVAANRATNASSWDRFLVPHPFASVAIVYGEPLRVAADGADREAEARELALRIARAEERAQSIVHAGFTEPGAGRNPA
jgi:lysophospholipid acyltransferase (LPLAT)-like uncharacterized protein